MPQSARLFFTAAHPPAKTTVPPAAPLYVFLDFLIAKCLTEYMPYATMIQTPRLYGRFPHRHAYGTARFSVHHTYGFYDHNIR